MAQVGFDELLGRLDGVQRRSNIKATALCPCHDDRNPSLSIDVKDGKLLVYCQSCKAGLPQVLEAKNCGGSTSGKSSRSKPNTGEGLKLYESPEDAIAYHMRRQGEEYLASQRDYFDVDGELISRMYRFEQPGAEKFIRYVSARPGGWVLSHQSKPRKPLDAHRLKDADRVLIGEGEKVADALIRLGYVATTAPGGANQSVHDVGWSCLAGKSEVAILVDNDDPGREYGRSIAKALHALDSPPATIKIVQLPGLEAKEDAFDFIEKLRKQGKNPKEIARAIDDAVASTTEAGKPPKLTLSTESFDTIKEEKVEWLWPFRIPLSMFTILVGVPGQAKSYFTQYLTACISRGWAFFEYPAHANPVGDVLLLASEDSASHVIKPRLVAHKADMSRIHIARGAFNDKGEVDSTLSLDEHMAQIRAWVKDHPHTRAVILDPVLSYMGDRNSNKETDVRQCLEPLVKMAEEFSVAVIGVIHLNKMNGNSAMDRVMGSRALSALPRAVHLFAKDPHDSSGHTKVMAPIKCNLVPEQPGLKFHIDQATRAVQWHDERSDIDADELLQPADRGKNTLTDQAVQFLTEYLSGGIAREQTAVEDAATRAGIKTRTLRDAKKRLKVQSEQVRDANGSLLGWSWKLPDATKLKAV